MTTFTELQCFNKLLLDKMKKMEEQLEQAKQYERLYLTKTEDYEGMAF